MGSTSQGEFARKSVLRGNWDMCHLVVMWFSRTGCLAMRTRAGQDLVEMKRRIEERFCSNDLQLVTITRSSAYGEYEPYEFVSSEKELVDALARQAA